MESNYTVIKSISKEVTMKKLKLKKRYMILSLVAVLTIVYMGLRYYIKPEWFDSKFTYHKVYQYKVSKIKPQKKIIKDINIEIIHDQKEQKPTEGQWQESTRTDIKGYNDSPILHVTFTDKTKADIPLVTGIIGPAFSQTNVDRKLYQKLSYRFPKIQLLGEKHHDILSTLLMLYQGDTLFQIPDESTVIQFQVKNPKNGKLQTYYQYGGDPDFDYFRPVFFLQTKSSSSKEKQEFFDDYHPSTQKNYWDRSLDFSYDNLSVSQNSHFYKLFYSDRFSNLPLGVSPTGNTFKTTITDTYILPDENRNSEGVRVASQSKTYTDKNEYTTEILSKNVN